MLQNNPPKLSRNFSGATVMVWAAFCVHSNPIMGFIFTKINSEIHTDFLKEVLILFLEEKMEENLIFQQDNTSIHVSGPTKNGSSKKI
jgi:hypothetical protein